MTDFLVKTFVKDYENISDLKVRSAYGVLTGCVGILCNVLLFLAKLIIGFALNSISVMADAINNLSDAASSTISLVGVKMAEKPADAEHPFGHGRIEYISALIVAFLILQVGFSFFKNALGKIFDPQPLSFQWISLVILILSIVIKLWLGLFNRTLGKRIDSKVMMAVAGDSLGDSITTAATIISLLVFQLLNVNIDGFVGVIVAIVVLFAGFNIAKDTLEPLIGAPTDYDLCNKIIASVKSYPGIDGTHDLIVHNYGPGRYMASVHAEISNTMNIMVAHELIDRIEKEVSQQLNISLVIHMDPIERDNPFVSKVYHQLVALIKEMDSALSIHDFRLVNGQNRINLIFDLVIPFSYTDEAQRDLHDRIVKEIKKLDNRYECVITIERSYLAQEEN